MVSRLRASGLAALATILVLSAPARAAYHGPFEGKWVYIYYLYQIYGGDEDRIVAELKRADVAGVCIKAHNGAKDLDSPEFARFVRRCVAEGIRVAFYGYIYLEPAAGRTAQLEAEAAERMVKRYEQEVELYLIDAEGEAKDNPAEARVFAREIRQRIGGMVKIGLASYRFPSLHRELPWAELRAACDLDSPQVYYRNGDPVANLARSKREFQAMSPRLPYFPAGDMYYEHGLQPTPQAVTAYLQACKDDPDIQGTLMWAMWQLHKVPALWEAFARFPWPVRRPTAGPPAAPTGLSPDGGAVVGSATVALRWTPPAAADPQRLQLEVLRTGGWRACHGWTLRGDTASLHLAPPHRGASYRWRVQARSTAGWGPPSAWARFRWQPGARPAVPTPPPTPPVPPAPPPVLAVTGLAPAGDEVATPHVDLSWRAAAGALGYEADIAWWTGSEWRPYYTYATTAPAKRFWPQRRPTAYTFRVRARDATGWGPWSPASLFRVR
ncbi:MAG: hypothetical protein HY722_00500 [Planctomycetes bacterium]|nr:hypothetical protein [Planctomycetota bacterium]